MHALKPLLRPFAGPPSQVHPVALPFFRGHRSHRRSPPNEMDDKEKEARRKRQAKKMTKIIAKAWSLPHAEHFQQCRAGASENGTANGSSPLDLTSIGQTLDAGGYHLGRHGWEKFAADLGGVYSRFLMYVYLRLAFNLILWIKPPAADVICAAYMFASLHATPF